MVDDQNPTDETDAANRDGPRTEEMDQTDAESVLEEIERKRSLRGWAVVALATVGITFSLFQVWLAARGFIFGVTLPGVGTIRLGALANLQVRAIHVNFALILAFLLYPTADGTGPLSRHLGRVPRAARDRLGDHPVTRGTERLRDLLRWAFLDPHRERVTPVDVLLIGLSLLPTAYYMTEFDGEIQNVVRLFGLRRAAPLGEVYPALEPLAVGPLATRPLAYLLGVLAILLVLEATDRKSVV